MIIAVQQSIPEHMIYKTLPMPTLLSTLSASFLLSFCETRKFKSLSYLMLLELGYQTIFKISDHIYTLNSGLIIICVATDKVCK